MQGMRRLPFIIGACVFLGGVSLELILIAVLPGGFRSWFALPDRPFEFAARVGMQFINALVAAYLAYRIRKIRWSMKRKEEEAKERERFLNHHVRNALSSLQYAAHITSDEKIIETCESAIERIVWALSSVRKQPAKKVSRVRLKKAN
jgi:hypothetical protein